jgi:glycosyltransferase involved in cell wall biosynthesis
VRILITNNALASPGGTETYVRDVASALRRRGHRPVAYSSVLGAMAREIGGAGVEVAASLAEVDPPDVIHGHHHFDTLAALLHFPGVPALSFCHGFQAWEETPLRFPRVRRWVAVDDTCLERVLAAGVDPARTVVVRNFVDLERFPPRPAPLPGRPRRGLVFSNYPGPQLAEIAEACRRTALALDFAGRAADREIERPEAVLAGYDLVFAKGRSAFEAMASGAAVVVCDAAGLGGLVTPERFDEMWRRNFGFRLMTRPAEAEAIAKEILGYDARAAAEVSRRLREVAGLEHAVDRLESLYAAVVAEQRAAPPEPAAEARAAAEYLAWLAPRVKGQGALAAERDRLRARAEAAEAALARSH